MLKERMINGQTLVATLAAFREEFPLSAFKFDHQGNPYIPISLVQNRVNDVLGFNYAFEIKEVQHVQVGNKHAFVPTTIFTIYDDDGNIVTRTSSTKGKNVIFFKTDPKSDVIDYNNPKDIANDAASAGSMAFKKCCGNLGMPFSIPALSLQINGAFLRNKACIKVNVINTLTNENRELIIWNNSIESLGKKRVVELTKCPKSTLVKVHAKETTYKGIPQYIVTSFLEKSS